VNRGDAFGDGETKEVCGDLEGEPSGGEMKEVCGEWEGDPSRGGTKEVCGECEGDPSRGETKEACGDLEGELSGGVLAVDARCPKDTVGEAAPALSCPGNWKPSALKDPGRIFGIFTAPGGKK
jgi:hypothetical protein